MDHPGRTSTKTSDDVNRSRSSLASGEDDAELSSSSFNESHDGSQSPNHDSTRTTTRIPTGQSLNSGKAARRFKRRSSRCSKCKLRLRERSSTKTVNFGVCRCSDTWSKIPDPAGCKVILEGGSGSINLRKRHIGSNRATLSSNSRSHHSNLNFRRRIPATEDIEAQLSNNEGTDESSDCDADTDVAAYADANDQLRDGPVSRFTPSKQRVLKNNGNAEKESLHTTISASPPYLRNKKQRSVLTRSDTTRSAGSGVVPQDSSPTQGLSYKTTQRTKKPPTEAEQQAIEAALSTVQELSRKCLKLQDEADLANLRVCILWHPLHS